MAISQNGWVANDVTKTASLPVPGTTLKLRVRTDAPGLVLLEVASAFDRLVEDIDNYRGALDDWGYAERPIRGGTALSNHASGTAIDLNAPKHPLGKAGTFTAAQRVQINRILAATGGVVRWGGNYTGRKDEMHFEITDGMSVARCVAALNSIRLFNVSKGPAPVTSKPPTVPGPVPSMTKADVMALQKVLNAWYPTRTKLVVDGDYGPATIDAVKYAQSRLGLVMDGIAGPATRAKLGLR